MSDSVKEALRKAGLAPPDAPKPAPARGPRGEVKWLEELPEDATLPPLFDAPARTKITQAPTPTSPVPKKP